ncbi:ComF family protein [Aerophototrophica crusticola]|uniref:ComF family protein n=1 Tax=Aerophototrophica crusticola TaxID=1709002 RepID=A0A858RC23_9PROT|nr:ComF family protein [Rhodospirillaceae bacterium B3]
MTRSLRAGALLLLDLILPPRCLSCGADVAQAGALCGACWAKVDFLGPPQCACCGLPFEVAALAGDLCAGCIRKPPPYARCRSVFAYDPDSRGLVLAFKHADRTDAAPGFAAWMARAGAELLADADIVAPVPLHRWRLFRRRYNQAALLALGIGKLSGRTVAPDLLARRRDTGNQGGRSRVGRARNVAGAFTVRPAYKERVKGKRVLLVDDVYTTGATAGECAKALLRAGAAAVDVLTLARVVKPVGTDLG